MGLALVIYVYPTDMGHSLCSKNDGIEFQGYAYTVIDYLCQDTEVCLRYFVTTLLLQNSLDLRTLFPFLLNERKLAMVQLKY
jgi:hypothetical protein